MIVVKTLDSLERRMNPVAMTIISPWKEYWANWRSNQRPPVLKSCMLPMQYDIIKIIVKMNVCYFAIMFMTQSHEQSQISVAII